MSWNGDTLDTFGHPELGHTATPGVHSHDADPTQFHHKQTTCRNTHPYRKICYRHRVPPQGYVYQFKYDQYNRNQQLRITWGPPRKSSCPSRAATIPDHDPRRLMPAGCVTIGRSDGAARLGQMIFSCKIIGPLDVRAYVPIKRNRPDHTCS